MNDPRTERLRALAEQACAQENCRLYDLEFVSGSSGKGRAVRVYIERSSPDAAPVGIEDCANVSRSLSLLLDVEDAVTGGNYDLEVSTPGLDRILRLPWHFEAVLGKKIELKTRSTMDQWNPEDTRVKGRLRITGSLERVEGDRIVLNFEGTPLQIPIAEIEKAKVVFKVETKAPPAKGSKKPYNKVEKKVEEN